MAQTITTGPNGERLSTFNDHAFWTKHNSDRSQTRINRRGTDGEKMLRCSVCGADLNPERAQQVHIVAGGGAVLHPDDESIYVADGGDMGAWFLGPECAKLFPAAFRDAYRSFTG